MTRLSQAITSAPQRLNRRAILVGAAWAIPAIASTTLAPAASASMTTTLAFDRTAYTGTLCAAITGASVTVSIYGVATAGTSVTVSTSTGYRFDNGASTFTGVSDANGRVSLPPIRVQAGGTTGTITATTTGAMVTATLMALPSTTTQIAHRRVWTATGAEYHGGSSDVTVPTGSRAVGTLVTLDPSGVLRRAASTIASGVTSALAELEKSNYLTVTYVDASGMHRRMWTDTGAAYPAANVDAAVPANSVAIGTFVTLDPVGVLRRVSATIASGVNSAFAELDGNDNLHVTYVDAAGMHRRVWTAGGSPYAPSNIDVWVPVGSIAVGTLLTLGPDGVLRKGSTAVDAGVTSAFAELDDNNYLHTTYVNATGMHRRVWTDTGATYPPGNVDATVPADATAVGTSLTLDTTGTLRKGVDTVATGVTSAFAEMDKDDSTVVTWVDGAC